MQNEEEKVVWQLFEQTGNPAYYCLFNRIKNDERKDC